MQSKDKKYILHHSADTIHTGQLLKEYYDSRRIHKSALSRKLGRKPGTVGEYTKNASIQTSILWEICHALQHNFFKDIAATLPDNFSTDAPIKNEQEVKIAELEHEVMKLQVENSILLKALNQGK